MWDSGCLSIPLGNIMVGIVVSISISERSNLDIGTVIPTLRLLLFHNIITQIPQKNLGTVDLVKEKLDPSTLQIPSRYSFPFLAYYTFNSGY